jgi:hypothetical protein
MSEDERDGITFWEVIVRGHEKGGTESFTSCQRTKAPSRIATLLSEEKPLPRFGGLVSDDKTTNLIQVSGSKCKTKAVSERFTQGFQ